MNTSTSKITLSSWKKSFDSLPTDHKNALYFIAIYAAPVRKIRVQEFCGCLNVTPVNVNRRSAFTREVINKNMWDQNKIKKVAGELEKLGWIDVTPGFLQCKNGLRERIVHHLYATGKYQQYADVLFPIIGGRYFATAYTEGKSWERPRASACYFA